MEHRETLTIAANPGCATHTPFIDILQDHKLVTNWTTAPRSIIDQLFRLSLEHVLPKTIGESRKTALQRWFN